MKNYEDFLKCNEIRELDNCDLIKYKHALEAEARALQEHMAELREVWDYVCDSLKTRLDDLVWDELTTEEARMQDHYSVEEEASFKIH